MTGDALGDTLARDELLTGLSLGAIGLAVVFSVARLRSSTGMGDPTPVAGLLVALGGAAAIALTSSLPAGVAVGLVLLAAAGHLARGSVLGGLLLALPGAGAIAAAGPTSPSWVPVVVGITAVLGAVTTANLDRRRAREGLGPLLLAVSAAGIYLVVPETRAALPVVGAAVPLAFAGWPKVWARLGDAGAFASVGLLCWVVADGGITRSSAVIGGLACLGILVVEPATRALRALRADHRVVPPYACVGVHVVTILIVARVAGVRESAAAAIFIASATLLAAGCMLHATLAVTRSP